MHQLMITPEDPSPGGWRHPLLPRLPVSRDERLELTAIGFAWSMVLVAGLRLLRSWGIVAHLAQAVRERAMQADIVIRMVLGMGDGGRLLLALALSAASVYAAYRLRRHALRIAIPVLSLILFAIVELCLIAIAHQLGEG